MSEEALAYGYALSFHPEINFKTESDCFLDNVICSSVLTSDDQ